MMIEQRIKNAIRDVKDFPKEGILFKDVTPLMLDPILSNDIADAFIEHFKDKRIDAVCAIESRGFLYGFLLAHKLKIPFIPIRKKGKLPGLTVEYTYELEYGSATVEVHLEDVKENWNVLIHDDLLATGGTAAAAAELLKIRKAHVAGYAFVVELGFLGGSERLRRYAPDLFSLAKY